MAVHTLPQARIPGPAPRVIDGYDYRQSPAENALNTIIKGADFLGSNRSEVFLLVRVTRRAFDWMVTLGADIEEMEEDNEDCCLARDDEPHPFDYDGAPGDPDDIEEDDHGGGNVEDEGEETFEDLEPEDEHGPSWPEPALPVIVIGDDGRATLPDGSIIQWQAMPGERPAMWEARP